MNVALSTNGASASQSSNAYSSAWGASLAIDGNTNRFWSGWSVTHTSTETDPWWKVQLQREFSISDIIVYNRSDDCCIDRLNNFRLTVMYNNAVVYLYDDSASTAQSITMIPIEPNVIGDEVKIEIFGPSRTLNLAEVVVEILPSIGCSCQADQTDYRGTIARTINGNTCQAWDSQSPHSHPSTAANYPSSGLTHKNYCRNPEGIQKAWCYPTDPNIRWEYCDVPTCPSTIC
ncbi:hypothetical protein CTEN210_18380 [Chaetoceros tenuissimus]|uniref:Kringle domain-containing protein n=1 Tax=Chaetoceros tenuissimus TaxID=426638 RepID=A0AAD3DFW9_9STRA|nr:hypothetical protein CTEN210_18380 [Chaetoceros tenuissimus]